MSIPVLVGEAATKALIDSGARGVFMNEEWAQSQGLPITNRPFVLPIKGANSRTMGMSTKQTRVTLRVGVYTKDITFDLAQLGHNVILGLPWLKFHNPHIDWETERITFVSPRCLTQCLPQPIDVFPMKTSSGEQPLSTEIYRDKISL